MKAKILGFRRGKKIIKDRHFILEIKGIDKREKAKEFIGKKVSWKSPAGKILEGKVSALHGNKGHIRVVFPQGKGLPGQAINDEVEIND
jgi:ribosomal protein L35AE/L33A